MGKQLNCEFYFEPQRNEEDNLGQGVRAFFEDGFNSVEADSAPPEPPQQLFPKAFALAI